MSDSLHFCIAGGVQGNIQHGQYPVQLHLEEFKTRHRSRKKHFKATKNINPSTSFFKRHENPQKCSNPPPQRPRKSATLVCAFHTICNILLRSLPPTPPISPLPEKLSKYIPLSHSFAPNLCDVCAVGVNRT